MAMQRQPAPQDGPQAAPQRRARGSRRRPPRAARPRPRRRRAVARPARWRGAPPAPPQAAPARSARARAGAAPWPAAAPAASARAGRRRAGRPGRQRAPAAAYALRPIARRPAPRRRSSRAAARPPRYLNKEKKKEVAWAGVRRHEDVSRRGCARQRGCARGLGRAELERGQAGVEQQARLPGVLGQRDAVVGGVVQSAVAQGCAARRALESRSAKHTRGIALWVRTHVTALLVVHHASKTPQQYGCSQDRPGMHPATLTRG